MTFSDLSLLQTMQASSHKVDNILTSLKSMIEEEVISKCIAAIKPQFNSSFRALSLSKLMLCAVLCRGKGNAHRLPCALWASIKRLVSVRECPAGHKEEAGPEITVFPPVWATSCPCARFPGQLDPASSADKAACCAPIPSSSSSPPLQFSLFFFSLFSCSFSFVFAFLLLLFSPSYSCFSFPIFSLQFIFFPSSEALSLILRQTKSLFFFLFLLSEHEKSYKDVPVRGEATNRISNSISILLHLLLLLRLLLLGERKPRRLRERGTLRKARK